MVSELQGSFCLCCFSPFIEPRIPPREWYHPQWAQGGLLASVNTVKIISHPQKLAQRTIFQVKYHSPSCLSPLLERVPHTCMQEEGGKEHSGNIDLAQISKNFACHRNLDLALLLWQLLLRSESCPLSSCMLNS